MTVPDPAHVEAMRQVSAAAAVAEKRHPNCGALVWLRQSLGRLPADLRVAVGELAAHPEDDAEDGRTEVARLVRENAELRRRLADAEGRQLDLFSAERAMYTPVEDPDA